MPRSPQKLARKRDKRRAEQEARNAARVANDPRRKVFDQNAFPNAPPEYAGIARTLSRGI